jgi:hypothetical protein
MTRFRVLTAITDSAQRRTTQWNVKATIRNGDGLILSSKTGVIDITQAPIIKGINSILLTLVLGFEKKHPSPTPSSGGHLNRIEQKKKSFKFTLASNNKSKERDFRIIYLPV